MTEQKTIQTGNALTIGNPVAKAPGKPKAPAKSKRNRTRKAAQQATSGQQVKAATTGKGKASGQQQASGKATGKGKSNGQQQAKAQQASGKAEGQTAKGSVPAGQIADNAVIKVLVEGNPKKPNTWAHFMFETLRRCDGKTVADYADTLAKAEGLPKGYRARPELQLALRREWVRLEQPK